MQLGHRGGHVGIALVGAYHAVAGGSHAEVASRHAGTSLHELVAQMETGAMGEISRVVVSFLLRYSLLLEHPAHFLAFEVDGRHHDMARLLMQELDDALAEVGLHHIDAVLFQIGVHFALFGEHGLRLHHLRHTVALQNGKHCLVELRGILRPMHLHSAALQRVRELLQIIRQMGDGVLLYLRGMFAQVFPLRQLLCHLVALLSHRPEGGVVPTGLLCIRHKAGGSLGMYCAHNPAANIWTT